MKDNETLEEVKLPIGKFIIDNAISTQGTDGAYYHYSEVCKLLRLKQKQDNNKYNEKEVFNLIYNIFGEYAKTHNITINGNELNNLFEQFKNKK